MLNAHLVPAGTTVTAQGDGAAVEIGAAQSRVFLLTASITRIVEQESIDLSVWGSAEGNAWGDKPLLVFPQKFYTGQHPLLLDLSGQSEVRFLRAHWEVNRWGRGTEVPMFEFGLAVQEVPQEILASTRG